MQKDKTRKTTTETKRRTSRTSMVKKPNEATMKTMEQLNSSFEELASEGKKKGKKKIRQLTKEEKKLEELRQAQKVIQKAKDDAERAKKAWRKFQVANSKWARRDRRVQAFHDLIVWNVFNGNQGNPELAVKLSQSDVFKIADRITEIGSVLCSDAMDAANDADKKFKKYVKISSNSFMMESGLKGKRILNEIEKQKEHELVTGNSGRNYTLGMNRDAYRTYGFSFVGYSQFEQWLLHGYPYADSSSVYHTTKDHTASSLATILNTSSDKMVREFASYLKEGVSAKMLAFKLASHSDTRIQELLDDPCITTEAVGRILNGIQKSKKADVLTKLIDHEVSYQTPRILENEWQKWVLYNAFTADDDPNDMRMRVYPGIIQLEDSVVEGMFDKIFQKLEETIPSEFPDLSSVLNRDDVKSAIWDKVTATIGTEHKDRHIRQLYFISSTSVSVMTEDDETRKDIMSFVASVFGEAIGAHLLGKLGDEFPDNLRIADITRTVTNAISDVHETDILRRLGLNVGWAFAF